MPNWNILKKKFANILKIIMPGMSDLVSDPEPPPNTDPLAKSSGSDTGFKF
jgi:hypothetical protein